MTKTILLFLTAIFFISCSPGNKESIQSNQVPSGCYTMEENGNLVALQLTGASETVSGKLVYALAEKDKNQGFFTGLIEEDYLVGIYTFQSEGVESKREVSFLIKDNQLIEGFGEIETDGDTSKLKDIKTLDFNSSIVLKETDCGVLDNRCVFEFGTVRSALSGTCIVTAELEVKLSSLKDGAITRGPLAYLAFNEDLAKAELFLPQTEAGIVLSKTVAGNWENETYRLLSWKGYVLQQNGIAIYGGQ